MSNTSIVNAEARLSVVIQNSKYVLDIGSGKLSRPMLMSSLGGEKVPQIMVNVDRSYDDIKHGKSHLVDVEGVHLNAIKSLNNSKTIKLCFLSMDIFEFLDTYKYRFDTIVATRIFEHMFFDSGEIGRLLHQCYDLLEADGHLHIIVPNHLVLAKEIMDYDDKMLREWAPAVGTIITTYESKLLKLNTEFMNTRSDPHGSLWTPQTARNYIGKEGVFEILSIDEKVLWQGRDCYMWIELRKK